MMGRRSSSRCANSGTATRSTNLRQKLCDRFTDLVDVDEECVVIEGHLRIGELTLGPGGFHRVRHDVLDADSTTDDGCVIYLRGASPKAEHLV